MPATSDFSGGIVMSPNPVGTPTRNNNDEFSSESFWQRVEQLIVKDQEKTDLLKDLLLRYDYVCRRYQAEREQRRDEHQAILKWQQDKSKFEESYTNMQLALERDPFVLVLIDGDGMIFQDTFLQAGDAGGRRAAAALNKAILDYIHHEVKTIPTNVQVVCRIYANVHGLAKVLVQIGIIEDVSVFEEFARGFTCGQTLFDFVDVGSGKDRADAKINESFKLYLNDFHCRQIFFGCSHDNGYARLLDNHVNDHIALSRITLLEGVPFEKELVAMPFATKLFPSIFRTVKLSMSGIQSTASSMPRGLARNYNAMTGLPSRFPPPGTHTNLLDSPTPIRLAMHLPRSPSSSTLASNEGSILGSGKPSPAKGWAAVAAQPAPPVQLGATVAYKPVDREEVIARNRLGQRVDPPCRDYDKAEVDRVKKLKLCNVHFLRHECPFGQTCTHRHDYTPSKDELSTLRLVARLAPCLHGSGCNDIKCFYGHRCNAPTSKNGSKGAKSCILGEQCKFDSELHDIDCNVVKTLVIR